MSDNYLKETNIPSDLTGYIVLGELEPEFKNKVDQAYTTDKDAFLSDFIIVVKGGIVMASPEVSEYYLGDEELFEMIKSKVKESRDKLNEIDWNLLNGLNQYKEAIDNDSYKFAPYYWSGMNGANSVWCNPSTLTTSVTSGTYYNTTTTSY